MICLLYTSFKRLTRIFGKNSVEIFSRSFNVVGGNEYLGCLTLCTAQRPVSYTHLDVYKRQVQTATGFIKKLCIKGSDIHAFKIKYRF